VLPEPWCQFCHKMVDGKLVFDYGEHHAILCGIGDGLLPWLPEDRQHSNERHYYIMARGITTIVVVVGLILLTRSLI